MTEQVRSELELPYKAILVGGPSDGHTYSMRSRKADILVCDPMSLNYWPPEQMRPEFAPMPKISRYVLTLINKWPKNSNVLVFLYEKDVQS
jgi:hypothetical protein